MPSTLPTSRPQRQVFDATTPITIVITENHVALAQPGEPGKCVVALAIKDRFGDMLEGAEVGSNVTKIFTSDRIIRYRTPNTIKRQVPVFDKTEMWNLPSGEYTLQVMSPTSRLGARPARWHKHRNKKPTSGRDMFKGRAVPTRRCTNLQTLQAAA